MDSKIQILYEDRRKLILKLQTLEDIIANQKSRSDLLDNTTLGDTIALSEYQAKVMATPEAYGFTHAEALSEIFNINE